MDSRKKRISDPILPGERGSNYLAIEQKYVQASYKLDRELSRFEEIYRYSVQLNDVQDDDEFYETACESVIDIFEVEGSGIWLLDETGLISDSPSYSVTEDDKIAWSEISQWLNTCEILQERKKAAEVAILGDNSDVTIKDMHHLIASVILDKDKNVTGVIVGFVKQDKKDFYETNPVEYKSSFNVFRQMLGTLIINRLDQQLILEQLREVEKAKDDAEKANLAKSQFLSNMSHELRTPLNAILGFSQLLELSDSLTQEDSENLKEISKAGNHLLNLINEILDLSKIEAGRLEMSIENVEVKTILHECVSLVNTLANNRSIKIDIAVPKGIVVLADYMRLKQAILNLISNAIKYNHEQGTISISVIASNDNLRINITDTGVGIPEDKISYLFKPFGRLVDDKSGVEGTGIGLTITRKLIEMMNGQVGVNSKYQVGSTFWIEVPLIALGEMEGQIAENADLAEVDSQQVTSVDSQGIYTKKILYVDDNPANIRLIEKILARKPGVEVITALDPKMGIDIAMTELPDLVLLDIHMPGMDGYDVLRFLKKQQRFENLPVIALTANAMQKEVERGLQAGFYEYLTKPLDIPKFNKIIDELLTEPLKY